MGQTKAEMQAEIRRLKYRIRALEHAAVHKSGSGLHFRPLFENLPVILWTTDTDLRFTSFEGAAADFSRFDAASVVGLTMYDFFETAEAASLPIDAALRALRGETLQYSHEWHEKYMLVHLAPFWEEGRDIVGLTGVSLDLTEQRESDARLRDVENRYKALLNAIDEVVLWYEFDGTLMYANAAAERLLGRSAAGLRGRKIAEVLTPESAAVLRHNTHVLLGGAPPAPLEVSVVPESGRPVSLQLFNQLVLSYGQPFCVQATGRDMTERKALEQQLRTSQKTHAIGLLSGGVAHDLVNLLTCTLGSAHLLKQRNAGTSEELHKIITSSEQAARLAKTLSSYSASSRNAIAPADLHELINEVLAILQRTVSKRIRIVASLRANQSHVLGDASQLHQAIMNLCLNAAEAMPDGGNLRIYTHNNGDNIVLSVQDTGKGIPAADRPRIFEPFFTTKRSDVPAGLGLALVNGIVRSHNGAIHFDSELGGGTVFHMTLATCTAAGGRKPSRQVVGGQGRVLIVDDDMAACQVLGKMLRTLGYDVDLAQRSDAVKLYEQTHPHVDVVFFDFGVSSATNTRYLSRFRDINPGVRVVVCCSSTAAAPGGDGGHVQILTKPYRYQDLASVLTGLLRKEAAHNA